MMKKRILIVSPDNKGTIAMCSLNLYKALNKCDDVEVKCVLVHKFKGGLEELDGCEWCSDVVSSGISKLKACCLQTKWLRKIKKEFKPDTTVSTLISCTTINVLSGGKERKIGIFHAPPTQAKDLGRFSYFLSMLGYKFLFSHLDNLYCVSREVKRSIIDIFPQISQNKIEVVYNIHDKERIRSMAKESLSADETKVFSNPVILYCGRLDTNKAPDRLLKAFALQGKRKCHRDWQLVYIGKDSDGLWDSLRWFAEKENILGRVHYWGTKRNPYKYMSRAKALVSCSYSEGLPGVLIESLLLDTPVVSTNSSEGIWEILSCDKDYRKDLKSYYIAGKGIISSNLSSSDRNEYENDIFSLSMSLERIMTPGACNGTFFFEEKITDKNVVNKYL